MQPYQYELPPHLIAHTAAEPRDSARLLSWPEMSETTFRSLPSLLKEGDLLILNTSKVIPARLYGHRPAREIGNPDIPVEFLLHRPLKPNLTEWQTFAKPARRLKVGDLVQLPAGATAEILQTEPYVAIKINTQHATLDTYLEEVGHTPLPPYIHAEDTAATRARYQTVYADATKPGSVAAPTAGLHFTPEVFAELEAKGIKTAAVTLHVGAGTFLNPTPEQLASGTLHAEYAMLPPETAAAIAATKRAGGNVIPVGTTALRTIETWAKLGSPAEGFAEDTTLFIRPGYQFKVADRLLTNFHLPGSSLLMLVGAFIGEDNLEKLYAHAIANQFRFYSFGDSSLLTRQA
ncbi:MAG: tRNA preQ1(34) S-adenosylmethionine ribosyltransferase-isomerase QueA [Alphaproteobacteria bacterium]|nr:MAG: tRNA preQ1(34) S-adenosylmethionine ribosyltransferase-isomerase QueA [Alphaproteobacteria bacterium]